jgi:predicted AAA+ superfamily ATPase
MEQLWVRGGFPNSFLADDNLASTVWRDNFIRTFAYMVRVLPPWFENIRKRQVKAPKIYIRDSGVLHTLLQLSNLADLQGHPKIGASWEGFAVEHVISELQTCDAYFWATHAGAELDLMVTIKGKRYGFEFKYADAPGRTRSMHIALQDLKLEHLWVVYPGNQEYRLHEKITVAPLKTILSLIYSKSSHDNKSYNWGR